jgi:hypothetical protein
MSTGLQCLTKYAVPLCPTASTVGTVSSDSATGSSDLEARVKQMEKTLDSMKHQFNYTLKIFPFSKIKENE